jgi:hypothetical protein
MRFLAGLVFGWRSGFLSPQRANSLGTPILHCAAHDTTVSSFGRNDIFGGLRKTSTHLTEQATVRVAT